MPKELTEAERKAEGEMRHRIYKATRNVSRLQDIPEETHFAALFEETYSFDDGYGRDGGEGANARGTKLAYVCFDTDEAMNAWIIQNNGQKKFRIIHVRPASFELKTSITVKAE